MFINKRFFKCLGKQQKSIWVCYFIKKNQFELVQQFPTKLFKYVFQPVVLECSSRYELLKIFRKDMICIWYSEHSVGLVLKELILENKFLMRIFFW